MKANILIYGTGNYACKFIENYLNRENVEIIAFVESVKTKEKFFDKNVIEIKDIDKYKFDMIIVASMFVDEIKRNMLQYNVNINECIFLNDIYKIDMLSKNILTLFLYLLREDTDIEKYVKFIIGNKVGNYTIIDVNNRFTFLGNSNDYIPKLMCYYNKVYSCEDVKSFFVLAEKFYSIKRDGYFFDCGCNILTTSVYAHSLNTELKFIGFEPIKRTFDIARVNALLNGIDNRVTLINKGLSNKAGEAFMRCCEEDCGQNSIIHENIVEDMLIEKVKLTTFDSWCEENSFRNEDISYIWIDAEGYEGFIIDGMMNILSIRPIPLFLEFRKEDLENNDCLNLLIQNLEKIYTKFVFVQGGRYDLTKMYPICELKSVSPINTNVFMIP